VKRQSLEEKNLTRRYLIWCYKTTKEDADRIDRYFTQIIADTSILSSLKKSKDCKDKNIGKKYCQKIRAFELYMQKKEEAVLSKKYLNRKKRILQPEYCYLKNRLRSIEEVIVKSLGKNELSKIKKMYEAEMTRRILESREHT